MCRPSLVVKFLVTNCLTSSFSTLKASALVRCLKLGMYCLKPRAISPAEVPIFCVLPDTDMRNFITYKRPAERSFAGGLRTCSRVEGKTTSLPSLGYTAFSISPLLL